MLTTVRTKIYSDKFAFYVFGSDKLKTKVYDFFRDRFEINKSKKGNEIREKLANKLTGVLQAINTNPLIYQHQEKFKRIEGEVWEVKIHAVRIACVWDKKPDSLVAIYAFDKKSDKWKKKDLIKMRNEKAKYERQGD